MHFTLLTLLAAALVSAAPQAAVTTSSSAILTSIRPTATIPFYSAPNTATPTATGNTAIPGSVIVITNSAGAGGLTDTFTYTAALSTVAPTGNVTLKVTGAQASVSNLLPDPRNLQTAAASSLSTSSPLTFTTVLSIVTVLISGIAGGLVMI